MTRIAARPVSLLRAPRSKYRAVRCVVDGHAFDSKAEAKRYAELTLLAKAERIRNLRRQHPWVLIVTDNEGERHTIGVYRSDFDFEERDPQAYLGWRWVVEDVKGGPIPPLSAWKIRHCEAQYHIKVRIVR